MGFLVIISKIQVIFEQFWSAFICFLDSSKISWYFSIINSWIFSANSFGLASLHQLRGRVGRDGNEGYCILVDDGNEDLSRLMFLESCSDGFRIAEEDLRLRGPGDFMGIEQSGFPSFNTLNIVSDFRMFEIARDEVQHIMFDLDDEDNKKYYNKIQNELDMNEFENKNALFD